MNNSVQNLEEAANLTSEFIYSLDNLPNEVNFILQEIKVKDQRVQELQQEIDRDSSRYVRHSLKASGSVPCSPSSRAPSPKDNAIPGKIQAAYADINQMTAEKCILAQTLIDLVIRTRSRLDSDLAKVRFLQGEAVDYTSALGTSYHTFAGASATDGYGALGRNPSLTVTESLRNVLASTPTLPDVRITSTASASQVTSAAPAYKKRRAAAVTSVKVNSPTKHRSASPTTTTSLATSQRTASRLSRQAITRVDTDVEEADDDAEGENDDAEDERLYCFCQKQSYGDMIACDNEGNCPFEWFHLSCVGMKQPTPEKWYCSVCTQQMNKDKKGTPATTKKGRKK